LREDNDIIVVLREKGLKSEVSIAKNNKYLQANLVQVTLEVQDQQKAVFVYKGDGAPWFKIKDSAAQEICYQGQWVPRRVKVS
jgi:hypothetical protein